MGHRARRSAHALQQQTWRHGSKRISLGASRHTIQASSEANWFMLVPGRACFTLLQLLCPLLRMPMESSMESRMLLNGPWQHSGNRAHMEEPVPRAAANMITVKARPRPQCSNFNRSESRACADVPNRLRGSSQPPKPDAGTAEPSRAPWGGGGLAASSGSSVGWFQRNLCVSGTTFSRDPRAWAKYCVPPTTGPNHHSDS
mmetsp:Transcript_114260/g.227362  ORF Transcript_114260/g.227362 Transcript_114260/m.227362 type:complete len:201 (-) Transcript_114260:496-1098(-)